MDRLGRQHEKEKEMLRTELSEREVEIQQKQHEIEEMVKEKDIDLKNAHEKYEKALQLLRTELE